MSKQIYAESIICLAALSAGFKIAIFYDAIEIIKKVFTKQKWLVPIGDLSFWIGTFLILSQMIQSEAGGSFRWYIVFFSVIAIYFYKKNVKEYIVDFMSTILRRTLDIVISLFLLVFQPLSTVKKKLTGNIKLVKIALCKRIYCHNGVDSKHEP